MNRFIYFILIFLWPLLSARSQEERNVENFKFGLELNLNASLSSFNYTPTFSFRMWDKHKIDLGIGTSIIDDWNFPAQPFTGFEFTAGYKFFPVAKTKKLNFYFHFLTKHFLWNAKSTFTGGMKTVNYQEYFIGYGFEVPIGERFYFHHDFGLGFLHGWRTYSNQSTEWDWQEPFVDGYIRIGFGYKFKPKN